MRDSWWFDSWLLQIWISHGCSFHFRWSCIMDVNNPHIHEICASQLSQPAQVFTQPIHKPRKSTKEGTKTIPPKVQTKDGESEAPSGAAASCASAPADVPGSDKNGAFWAVCTTPLVLLPVDSVELWTVSHELRVDIWNAKRRGVLRYDYNYE